MEKEQQNIKASSIYLDEAIFFASGNRGITLENIKKSVYKEKKLGVFTLRSLFLINLILTPSFSSIYFIDPDKNHLTGLIFIALCVLLAILFGFLIMKVNSEAEAEYNYIVSVPKELPKPLLDKIYDELKEKGKKVEKKQFVSIEELDILRYIGEG